MAPETQDEGLLGSDAPSTPVADGLKAQFPDPRLILGMQIFEWGKCAAHTVQTGRNGNGPRVNVPEVTVASLQIKIQYPCSLPDGSLHTATWMTGKEERSKLAGTFKAIRAARPDLVAKVTDHPNGRKGPYKLGIAGVFNTSAAAADDDTIFTD